MNIGKTGLLGLAGLLGGGSFGSIGDIAGAGGFGLAGLLLHKKKPQFGAGAIDPLNPAGGMSMAGGSPVTGIAGMFGG